MEYTERINRINANLDKHFKSNHGAWWVNNEPYCSSKTIALHRGIGGDRINPAWVALYIFRTEPSVELILTRSSGYTRSTLRRAGYKV